MIYGIIISMVLTKEGLCLAVGYPGLMIIMIQQSNLLITRVSENKSEFFPSFKLKVIF